MTTQAEHAAMEAAGMTDAELSALYAAFTKRCPAAQRAVMRAIRSEIEERVRARREDQD